MGEGDLLPSHFTSGTFWVKNGSKKNPLLNPVQNSVSKDLLSTYYVPGPGQGAGQSQPSLCGTCNLMSGLPGQVPALAGRAFDAGGAGYLERSVSMQGGGRAAVWADHSSSSQQTSVLLQLGDFDQII